MLYTSPPGRPVHSDTNSTSLGTVLAAITRDDYSLTFPIPSIARCSFTQMIELGCRGENENAKTLKR